jgi:hypothetical protein
LPELDHLLLNHGLQKETKEIQIIGKMIHKTKRNLQLSEQDAIGELKNFMQPNLPNNIQVQF